MHTACFHLTNRRGGVSRAPFDSLNLGLHVGDDDDSVIENRSRAAAELGAKLDDLVFGNQTHGATVAIVDSGDRGRGARTLDDALPATDGLVTETPGLVLCVLVADCVPILLMDRKAGRLGVVHAGWRGAASGVVPSALAAFGALGSRPEDLTAMLGPSIGFEAFEVGEEVVDALGLTGTSLRVNRDGARPHVDLAGVVGDQLVDMGVKSSNLTINRQATGRANGEYFSARDGQSTGRFGILAVLRAVA